MSEDGRRALLFAATLTVAVGGLAGVVARMTVFFPMEPAVSTIEARIGAALVVGLGLAGAIAVVASLTVLPLYAAVSERVPIAAVPWIIFLVVIAVGGVWVGFVGVQPFAAGVADTHVDTYGGSWAPSADFEVSVDWVGDDRAIVTFTHVGGAPLYAEHVYVRGGGFAPVDGVDHRGPGPWQGSVSGERPRRGGAAIVEGDSVSLGVTGECSVGLVYEGDEMASKMTYYKCPEPRTVG